MTSVPSAPGAHAVILQWDHRQDDADNWESEYLRIKIFDRDAAKYGDIELPYAEGHSWIKRLEARTIHADGTIIPFDGKTYDKLMVKSRRVKVMARTFTFPSVEPGSIIEYYYLRDAHGMRHSPTHWAVQRSLPVLKETLWFNPAPGARSFYTTSGLPKGKKLEEKDHHFELSLEDLPPYEAEPFAPPERHTKARVDFYYTNTELQGDAYWTAMGKATAVIVELTLSNSRLIRRTADELVKDAATPEEKLRRIYARVQQIHNVSYDPPRTEQELEHSKVTPNRDIDDALTKGYGTHADLNRLFISLARAAGFESSLVLAASRADAFFAKQVLDATQLNHELAAVVVDGKERYFDPGTLLAPYGMLPWEVTAVPAMRLSKKDGTFIQLPHLKPSDALIRRRAGLHVDNGMLKGTLNITYSGEEALQLRLNGRNDDEAANRKAIEDGVKQWLPEGSTVKLKSVSGMKSADEPLVADFDIELPNLGSFAGSRILMPLAIFTVSSRNPFTANERKHDIYFEYECQSDDEFALTIPDGYAIESLPAGSEANLGGLAYKNSWSRDEHAVTLHRTLTVNTLLIARSNYEWVRRFYDSSLAADQETVILKH